MDDWLSEYKEMIDDCLATKSREDRLTEWEAEFLDSVETQMVSKNTISQKQIDVLERIWEKVTSRG